MIDENKIRGKVLSVFKSIAEFAQAAGWSYAKALRIVSGKQNPDTEDVRQMCEVLNITDPEQVASVFSLL